jgi:hypothetical protein
MKSHQFALALLIASASAVSTVATTINLGSGGAAHVALPDLSGITAYGWIRSDDPTRVAGGETAFSGGLDGVTDLRGYVGFDLSSLTPTDTVSGATLSLWSQGASTFNANGGVIDIGVTDIELTLLPDVIGFGDGMAGDATILGSNLPANWNNLNGLYGTTVAQQSANLDTIEFNDQLEFDVTSEVTAAVANGLPQITFGITAPTAVTHGARNFFAWGGMREIGSTAGSDIGPNLAVDFSPQFVAADVNHDGVVDSLDFQQISGDLFTATVDLDGVNIFSDVDGSGLVDFADFRLWKNSPEGAAVLAALEVPEPSGLVLTCSSALLLATLWRRTNGSRPGRRMHVRIRPAERAISHLQLARQASR